MHENQKTFYQMHECAGCRAKVTIEWSWPEDNVPTDVWLNNAQDIAEDVFAAAGPKSYDIVLALRGHKR